MQVNRPKEYRPELASVAHPQSREDKLRNELGLSVEDFGQEEEEEEDISPVPASKGPGGGKETVKMSGDLAARVSELEARNSELEKKLANDASRRDEQVETIKKLANSRMANITKGFEEKLSLKEKEFEELQMQASVDIESLAAIKKKAAALEAQLNKAGIAPEAQVGGDEGDDRLMAELDRLRKENAALRGGGAKGSSSPAGGGAGGDRAAQLDKENKDLKKTIDNLMEANAKLVSNTKTKIAVLEGEVERYRAGGGGAVSSGGGGDGEAIRKLQEVLKGESKAREDAVAEAEALRQELSSKNSSSGKANAAGAEEAKLLKVQLNEKEKAVAKLSQELKAAVDDASIRDKERGREVERLTSEVARLNSEGTAQLAETKNRIRKAGRKLMSDMQKLKASRDSAKQAVYDFQAELMPAMKSFYSPLKKAIGKVQKDNNEWAGKYKKEVEERKRLHNLVLELKGNIRVFCRVRPKLGHEDGEGCDTAILFQDAKPELEDNTVAVLDESKGSEKVFEFDHTFGPNSTQEEVFDEVEALVTSVLDGYNVCIFAYGQTGSGKTYTMEGSKTDKGINPRTLSRLFDQISERSQYEYTVEFSILEIYNEEIKDLLDPKPGKKLEVRQGPDGNFVSDLHIAKVKNFDDVISLWSAARENRTTFSNNINEHSSRSHLVISVYARGENRATGVQSYGKLHLVDLAGSERLSRTNATGDRLKEAQNINKSLSSLGDVIAAAAAKQGHIPYRNSKLTHVLQDSLGQDSKTLMIVQASPLVKDVGESQCSLVFASRARAVELGQAKKHTSAGKPKPR